MFIILFLNQSVYISNKNYHTPTITKYDYNNKKISQTAPYFIRNTIEITITVSSAIDNFDHYTLKIIKLSLLFNRLQQIHKCIYVNSLKLQQL